MVVPWQNANLLETYLVPSSLVSWKKHIIQSRPGYVVRNSSFPKG